MIKVINVEQVYLGYALQRPAGTSDRPGNGNRNESRGAKKTDKNKKKQRRQREGAGGRCHEELSNSSM